VEPRTDASPVRICVIDLGTNSFHALIVDANVSGSFILLDRIKEQVQLGEGGLASHRLSDEAMARGMEALRRIRLLAYGWGVEDYLAFATSAIREAGNGGKFIDRVQEELGIRIRTISGDTESQLIFEGVRRAVEMSEPTLVVDIGGGSTEFMIGTSDRLQFGTSLKVGAARMTAEFVTTDPISSVEKKRLRTHYREVGETMMDVARNAGVTELVGSSGGFENLSQVLLNRKGEVRNTIFQSVFSAGEFRSLLRAVIASNRDQRAAMSGLDERRVDQIVAAAVLVDVILKDLNIKTVRISPYALREGMVDYFIKQNYRRLEQLAPFSDVRRRSVFELGIRCQWEERHCYQVASLALQLFDACREIHHLEDEDRELLEYAGLLHDIGYHISRKNHHKHTHYLLQHADLRGFLPDEIDIMATVARYHAGSLPKRRHGLLAQMSEATTDRALKLSAILRVAEGLDRSHFQNVKELIVRRKKKKLRIAIKTESDPELDIWGARRGADLFEKVFGMKVDVVASR